MKNPLDLPGLTQWVETDSDGVLFDQLAARTGKGSNLVIFPIDETRGIILGFDHRPTPDEVEALTAWCQAQAEPKDEITLSTADIDALNSASPPTTASGGTSP